MYTFHLLIYFNATVYSLWCISLNICALCLVYITVPVIPLKLHLSQSH